MSTPETPVIPDLDSADDATTFTDVDTAGYTPSGADYVSARRFAEFPIRAETLWGIRDRGYDYATPVQNATIEAALAGRDLLVRAKTGTGKTAAFCVPIIDQAEDGGAPFAVILAPTRELAIQIGEECTALAAHRPCTVTVLYGGVAIGPQEDELRKKPAIVVGTPGRILDHLRRKNLDLRQARVAVLDEADEMLSMGFYEDVTGILDACSADRQIMLFSATISQDTQRLVQRYLRDPESVTLSTDMDQVGQIEHILYETRSDTHKVKSLLYLLDVENPTSAIIFCNTREDTATVATFLDRQGLDVQLISGELTQARRSQVMKAVKAGEVRFLVSTDVASRGIDISDLSHVINYSLPVDPPIYLHRVGRTGRIGKKGKAISLIGGPDLATRRTLESVHKVPFTVKPLPDAEGAANLRVEHQAAQIKAALGQLVFESYLPLVRQLKERPDGEMLLAAALRAFFQWDRTRRARMSDVDSVRDLHEARHEKERRESPRQGERRADRRDDRKPRPAPKPEELDELLLTTGDAPAVQPPTDDTGESEAAKKKRRRRKKKRGDGSAQAGDDTTGEDAGSDGDVDDLDSLLS